MAVVVRWCACIFRKVVEDDSKPCSRGGAVSSPETRRLAGARLAKILEN